MSQTQNLIKDFRNKHNRENANSFPYDGRKAIDEDFIKALVEELNELFGMDIWEYSVDGYYRLQHKVSEKFYRIPRTKSKGEIIAYLNSYEQQQYLYELYTESHKLRHNNQKLSSLEANKPPAESDELQALYQIAIELNNYFDGLVDVELNVKTKAISLKLDKLGGFQLDKFIIKPENGCFIALSDFRNTYVALSEGVFDRLTGIFGVTSYTLQFIKDLKYRAQSLKD